DAKIIESRVHERGDAPLGLRAVRQSIPDRIPEKRRYVVLAISEVGLGIDRDVALAGAKDVVVVKVAVHEPVAGAADLREELAGERHELAALALRFVEPTRHFRLDRAKRGRGRPPQA